MGATYQKRGKGSWRVCVHYGRQRERTRVRLSWSALRETPFEPSAT